MEGLVTTIGIPVMAPEVGVKEPDEVPLSTMSSSKKVMTVTSPAGREE